jgi:hypothetical protein
MATNAAMLIKNKARENFIRSHQTYHKLKALGVLDPFTLSLDFAHDALSTKMKLCLLL